MQLIQLGGKKCFKREMSPLNGGPYKVLPLRCLLLVFVLCVHVFSHVKHFATPWTAARKAPLSQAISKEKRVDQSRGCNELGHSNGSWRSIYEPINCPFIGLICSPHFSHGSFRLLTQISFPDDHFLFLYCLITPSSYHALFFCITHIIP